MKIETFLNKIAKQLSFCENLQEVIKKYGDTDLDEETGDFLNIMVDRFNARSFYHVEIPYKAIMEKFKIDNIEEARKFALKQTQTIYDTVCFFDYCKTKCWRFRIITYFSLIDDDSICIDFSDTICKYLKNKN